MALKHLPPTFCWSRIATESGEDLATIVLRKEWERRMGGGRFLWGISQPLGSSAQVAALRTGSLLALFSPMSGKPRAASKRCEDALLWNAWIDAAGQVRQLPPHAFVTSSAVMPSGETRERYYALVCSSPAELSIGCALRVHPERLRSVSTGKTLGAAQGTAVVDCTGRSEERDAHGKSYPVALAVELEAPYVVRLTQPSVVKAADLAQVRRAAREGDFDAYAQLVVRLRSRPPAERTRGFTRDLFDVPAGEAMPIFGAGNASAHATHAW